MKIDGNTKIKIRGADYGMVIGCLHVSCSVTCTFLIIFRSEQFNFKHTPVFI